MASIALRSPLPRRRTTAAHGSFDRAEVDRGQDVAQHALGKELSHDLWFGVGRRVDQLPQAPERVLARRSDVGISGGGDETVQLHLKEIGIL